MDIIYKTPYWIVILAEDQTYFGRSRVELIRRAATLSDVTGEEMNDFLHSVVKKFEHVLRTACNATMFNWSCAMNDAYLHNQSEPQVHWHVRPRYKDTIHFEDYNYTDPNFGKHYIRGVEQTLSPEIRKKLLVFLRKNF